MEFFSVNTVLLTAYPIATAVCFLQIKGVLVPSVLAFCVFGLGLMATYEFRGVWAPSPLIAWPDLTIAWTLPYIALRANRTDVSIYPYHYWCGSFMLVLSGIIPFIPHRPVKSPPEDAEDILSMPLAYQKTLRYRRQMIASQMASRVCRGLQQRVLRTLGNFTVEQMSIDLVLDDEQKRIAQNVRNIAIQALTDNLKSDAYKKCHNILKLFTLLPKEEN